MAKEFLAAETNEDYIVVSYVRQLEAETHRLKHVIEDMSEQVAFLNRLKAAGVANWEGYHRAFSDEDEEDYDWGDE